MTNEMFEGAITQFNKALEKKPGFRSAKFRKGFCLIKLNRYKEAMKEFDDCIEVDKNDVDCWYYKGVCLFALQKIKEAIRAFDITLSLNPKHPEAGEYKNKCEGVVKKIEMKKLIKENDKIECHSNSTSGSGNEFTEKEEREEF